MHRKPSKLLYAVNELKQNGISIKIVEMDSKELISKTIKKTLRL